MSEKLAATFSIISERFLSCDIIIADTLYRYNFKDSFSSVEALSLSKQKGDVWIEENKHFFKNLTIPYQIIRWDNCIQKTDFNNWLNIIKKLYLNDMVYKKNGRRY